MRIVTIQLRPNCQIEIIPIALVDDAFPSNVLFIVEDPGAGY